MPPKYPFSRNQPSGSSSSNANLNPNPNPNTNTNTNTNNGSERPVVVSASGRAAPNSPAGGADSPATLRARNISPRTGAGDTFASESSAYPSPTAILKNKAKGRKDWIGSGSGGVGDGDGDKENNRSPFSRLPKTKSGWLPLAGDSPGPSPSRGKTPTPTIPRYNARGYASRADGASGSGHDYPPEGSKSSRIINGLPASESHGSLASVSSTGAGVDEETNRFLSNSSRPMSYYTSTGGGAGASTSSSSEGHTPSSAYPPVMNYSLAAASYDPYDNPANGDLRRSPEPSLHGYNGSDSYNGYNGNGNGYNDYGNNGYSGYGGGYGSGPYSAEGSAEFGQSRVSLNSMRSEGSLTHFRKHDALNDSYGAFSISSKGGKRHLADMFSLPADPTTWSYLGPEADDDFHDPDIHSKKRTRYLSAIMTLRGASNLGCLAILFMLMVALFAGYPILSHFLDRTLTTSGAYNLGGINATGQLPDIGPFQLIDKDTPTSAYSYTSMETGDTWELVFSDEFNNDGRTFYGGDDPYWEAVDLHYWQTNNLEWYDPTHVTTKNGKLVLTLDNTHTNGMNYTGAMISSWNQFCFTGGYMEASVSLPGTSKVYGLWPAIWTMGNLGRAGYGGSLDGLWPYTYDACDVGTLQNQTLNGKPAVAASQGDPDYANSLSYLPGQRLSQCTCTSDTSHPGPVYSNGTFKGRAAPEIDMFEALVTSDTLVGQVSQSAQWAPFNPSYEIVNTSSTWSVVNDAITAINGYKGGVYQQATSGVSNTDQNCYTGGTGCFSTYGFEYSSGYDGYVTWVNNGKQAWTIRGAAMVANTAAQVSGRPISEEPMYMIINLGLSENFGAIDFDGLASLWPVTMEVDYIRVYQDPNSRNIGCDPPSMPTSKYISLYPDAYNNPNITVMGEISNFTKPKNRLIDTC